MEIDATIKEFEYIKQIQFSNTCSSTCKFSYYLLLGSWAVVEPVDRRLRFLRLNTAAGRDTHLPGWLKVHDNEIIPPDNGLLQRAVHVTTLHCENQVQSKMHCSKHLATQIVFVHCLTLDCLNKNLKISSAHTNQE
jgi:hypothetical protein